MRQGHARHSEAMWIEQTINQRQALAQYKPTKKVVKTVKRGIIAGILNMIFGGK